MVKIRQGNIFGRIGTGFAQGLAQALPEEIKYQRKRAGLQELADASDRGELSGAQFLAKAAGTYGSTPQEVQSFGELAKQQAKGKALLDNQNQNQPNPYKPFQEEKPKASADIKETPSTTKGTDLEEIMDGYRPKSQDEIFSEAGQLYNANPAKFANNPQEAINYVNQAEQLEEKKYNTALKRHEDLTGVQRNVIDTLRKHAGNLNAKVPANVYSEIEDKAIDALKPKSKGGKGLTEQQAAKEFGKELDDISRNYASVNALGDFGLITQKPQDVIRNIKSIQEKFKKRGDTENLADTLITQNGLSPQMAYAQAEPVHQYPKTNSIIKNLPQIKKNQVSQVGGMGGLGGLGISNPKRRDVENKTLDVSAKLAPLLKEEGSSPLAIAHELEKKGYDPEIWLDYVTNNRKDLDLKESQGRQLDKPKSLIGRLNDWWLSAFSGVQ